MRRCCDARTDRTDSVPEDGSSDRCGNNLQEQAVKEELNARETLVRVLNYKWHGRRYKGLESRLKQARLPWVKMLE